MITRDKLGPAFPKGHRRMHSTPARALREFNITLYRLQSDVIAAHAAAKVAKIARHVAKFRARLHPPASAVLASVKRQAARYDALAEGDDA